MGSASNFDDQRNSMSPPCKGAAAGDVKLQDASPDISISVMLRRLECWMLLFSGAVLAGAGLMVSVNAGQIVESKGFDGRTTSIAVTIFSISQAISRVMA